LGFIGAGGFVLVSFSVARFVFNWSVAKIPLQRIKTWSVSSVRKIDIPYDE
jgi:hypothetical protein